MDSWYSVASTLGGGVKRRISSKFVHISDLRPLLRKSREGKETSIWNYIFYDLTRFSSGLDRVTLLWACFVPCATPLAGTQTNEVEPIERPPKSDITVCWRNLPPRLCWELILSLGYPFLWVEAGMIWIIKGGFFQRRCISESRCQSISVFKSIRSNLKCSFARVTCSSSQPSL